MTTTRGDAAPSTDVWANRVRDGGRAEDGAMATTRGWTGEGGRGREHAESVAKGERPGSRRAAVIPGPTESLYFINAIREVLDLRPIVHGGVEGRPRKER